MFMEQPVAVIGGGDAALDEPLPDPVRLAGTIVHRRDTLRACRLCRNARRQIRSSRSAGIRWCERSKVMASCSASRWKMSRPESTRPRRGGRRSVPWSHSQHPVSRWPRAAQRARTDCHRPVDAHGSFRRTGCWRCARRFSTTTDLCCRRWSDGRAGSRALPANRSVDGRTLMISVNRRGDFFVPVITSVQTSEDAGEL